MLLLVTEVFWAQCKGGTLGSRCNRSMQSSRLLCTPQRERRYDNTHATDTALTETEQCENKCKMFWSEHVSCEFSAVGKDIIMRKRWSFAMHIGCNLNYLMSAFYPTTTAFWSPIRGGAGWWCESYLLLLWVCRPFGAGEEGGGV